MDEKKINLDISTKDLIDSEVQYGNNYKILHRSMKPYVYGFSTANGLNKNLCIFDLDQTISKLQQVCNFLYLCGLQKKNILLVGTKEKIREVIETVGASTKVVVPNQDKTVGFFYIQKRFMPGLFSNFHTFLNKLRKNDQFKHSLAENTNSVKNNNKAVKKTINKEIKKINKKDQVFKGILNMYTLPDVIIVVDIKHEIQCVKEAKRKNITVIGLVDTDCDCSLCDYFVPCNDESSKSVSTILGQMQKSYMEGLQKGLNKKTINPRV